MLDLLVQALRDVEHPRGKLYEVHWNILDSCKHGGLPQSRRRVFVVGIGKDFIVAPFVWPTVIPSVSLDEALGSEVGSPQDFAKLSKTKQKNILQMMEKYRAADHETDDYICEVGNSVPFAMNHMSPCLTHTRAGDHGYWSLRRNRVLTTDDMMRLQGVHPSRFPQYSTVVTHRVMGQIIGNAMCVNIMTRITKQILISLGVPVKV